MNYYSTKRISEPVGFKEAVLLGQPDDGGLFFPSEIPDLAERLSGLDNNHDARCAEELTVEILKPYAVGSLDEEQVYEAVKDATDFPIPIKRLNENLYLLELFHGPSQAFKDVGARFMSRCLSYFAKSVSQKIAVITATSGDTGGAVAAGFDGTDEVEVIILYPKGMVSSYQEEQIAARRKNVTALEVDGTFDDCQSLARSALADQELRKRALITSANSINIARWLPQQIYYWLGYSQIQKHHKHVENNELTFIVPSGNFGNIASGLLLNKSANLGIQFVAACNLNSPVPEFLLKGEYKVKRVRPTLSNAMDVGNPSNFTRIMELYDGDINKIKNNLTAEAVTDENISVTIKSCFEKYDYIPDPHTAVGVFIGEKLAERSKPVIVLATAHWRKFDCIKEILQTDLNNEPDLFKAGFGRQEDPDIVKTTIPADYSKVKEIINSKI
jgi:threonine synthase